MDYINNNETNGGWILMGQNDKRIMKWDDEMIKDKILDYYQDESDYNKRFQVYAFYTQKISGSFSMYDQAMRKIRNAIKRGDCDGNNLIIIDTKNDVKYNYLGKMTDLSLKELKSRGIQAEY